MAMMISVALASVGSEWRYGPQLTTARDGLGLSVTNGRAYVTGGSPNGGFSLLKSMEVLDLATGAWTAGASMPEVRAAHGTGVIGDLMYVVGGIAGFLGVGNTVASYNISSGKWSSVPKLQSPRAHLGVGVVRGKMYAVGGSLSDLIPLRSMEMFAPATGQWMAAPPMLGHGRMQVGVGVLGER